MGAAAPSVTVTIDGEPVKESNFISYVVERDMYQPDMAAVVLSNQNDIYVPGLKVEDIDMQPSIAWIARGINNVFPPQSPQPCNRFMPSKNG